MTIFDAVNKLIEHFLKKDSFNIEEDYANIMTISETPEEDKMCFLLALEDMEKTDIVKCFQSGKKRTYILKKPLISYDQNITLSGLTASMMSKVINDFCDKIKDKRDYCDPRNITEKDIRNLMFIASMNGIQEENKTDSLD